MTEQEPVSFGRIEIRFNWKPGAGAYQASSFSTTPDGFREAARVVEMTQRKGETVHFVWVPVEDKK